MFDTYEAIIKIIETYNKKDIDDSFKQFLWNNIKDTNYYIETGASKVVIADRDSDYVIKIPITGWYNHRCNRFNYFKYADKWSNSGQSFDYCKEEEYLFNLIKEKRLNFLFAETKTYKKLNNTTVYIQKKCVCEDGYDDSNTISENSFDIATDLSNGYVTGDLTNLRWLASVVEYYGQNVLIDLLNLIEELDLDDLHSGNIGYTLDGNPIIFDYVGFRE